MSEVSDTRGLHKKTVKIIQLMLGSTALGLKYHKIQDLTQLDYYMQSSVDNHDLATESILCITYFGLLFLKSMAVVSAITGQIPSGNYVKYFHIAGSLAYLTAEVLLLRKIWPDIIPIPLIGLIVSILLIIVLLLDVFNFL